MYRYAQSALSAAGLQLRGRGQPAQQEGARHGDSTRSGAPLSMYENVLRSVALSQKATQEIAHGVVLLSRGVFKQTQLVGGLVRTLLGPTHPIPPSRSTCGHATPCPVQI